MPPIPIPQELSKEKAFRAQGITTVLPECRILSTIAYMRLLVLQKTLGDKAFHNWAAFASLYRHSIETE